MYAIPVCLIDENPTSLRITNHLLREYYSEELMVVGTSLGHESAIAQVRDFKPRLILINLELHASATVHLIQRLRAAFPDIAIIAVGVLNIESLRQMALEAGADYFVSRAGLSEQLLPAARGVLGQASHRSTAVTTAFTELHLAFAAG